VAIVLPKLPRRRSSTRWAADSAPTLSLSLCRADGRYRMGQSLTATWQIGNIAPEFVIDGLEASVLWYTEGKGDEDLNVHHFCRWNDSHLQELDLTKAHGLQCGLPLTPLSYEGTLLRIRWCVRVRLFCSVGRDAVSQMPFQLVSDVAPKSVVAPTLVMHSEKESSVSTSDMALRLNPVNLASMMADRT
jgi:hypothetical protein